MFVCVYVCVLDLILTSPLHIEEEKKGERERKKEKNAVQRLLFF